MYWKSLFSFAGVVASLAAVAAPAVQTSGDAKTKLAIELMQVTHYDQNMQTMRQQVRTMFDKQFDSFATCDAAVPVTREYSNAIGEKVAAELDSESLKVDIASIYAEVFSEQDLRDIIAFYKSPLGAKLLERMPELMQKSMQVTQERVKSMVPALKKVAEDYSPRIQAAAKTCKVAEAK